IIRARMCEFLGLHSHNGANISELFLMGLFSLIDAMLDNNMEDIMQSLPLSKNIKQALLEKKGSLADYLKLVSSYESANWETFSSIISNINVDEKKFPEFYQEAVSWADSYLL
ncbi:MAG TPA: hypothetical protein VLM43_02570, partial [Desulfobacterales bacterium]|nr:hypothetical protein [Desulfobacterales bacterium]